MDYKKIEKLVYGYPTKNKYGFLLNEVQDLLQKHFPSILIEENEYFNNALMGITGMLDGEGNFVTYHCDIVKAISCALGERNLRSWEWD